MRLALAKPAAPCWPATTKVNDEPMIATDSAAKHAAWPSGRAKRRAELALGALTIVTAVTYLVGFVEKYPLVQFVRTPLLDLGKIGGYSPTAGMLFVLPWLILWSAYLGAAWITVQSGAGPRYWLWMSTATFSALLVFLYPITAADIFNYLLYGLVQHAGLNPIGVAPSQALGPDLLRFSAWPNYPSPYGPLWQLLSWAVTGITGQDLQRGVLGFKLAMVGAHLLNLALVQRVARSTRVAPGLAGLLYGWNPFILYETIGNGHNDAFMLTCLLTAVLALTGPRRYRGGALVCGAAAVVTKFVAAVWLPLLALAAWARLRGCQRGQLYVAGAVVAIVLTAAAMAPYGFGFDVLAGLRRQANLYTTSPGALVMILTTERSNVVSADAARAIVQVAAAIAVVLTLWTRRDAGAEIEPLVRALFDVTLVYLLVGTLWFQPWYLVPLIGLACLAGRDRFFLALLFAAGGLGSYVVYFYLWPFLGWGTERLTIQALAAGAAFLPVTAGLVTLRLRSRAARASA